MIARPTRVRVVAATLMACAAVAFPAAASADKVIRIGVKDTASYDQSLACFQFYAMAEELSVKIAASEGAAPQVVREETARAKLAAAMRAAWTQRINKARGTRTDDQVNVDLDKVGAPMVTTVNAALGGDKDAAKKHQAVEGQCQSFESIAEVEVPPKRGKPG